MHAIFGALRNFPVKFPPVKNHCIGTVVRVYSPCPMLYIAVAYMINTQLSTVGLDSRTSQAQHHGQTCSVVINSLNHYLNRIVNSLTI